MTICDSEGSVMPVNIGNQGKTSLTNRCNFVYGFANLAEVAPAARIRGGFFIDKIDNLWAKISPVFLLYHKLPIGKL